MELDHVVRLKDNSCDPNFMLHAPCIFLNSICQPTEALNILQYNKNYKIQFMVSISSYMFRHVGGILRESTKKRTRCGVLELSSFV